MWAALALAAVVRPIVRAPVLILLTPCLPWLPFAVEGMPHGVVHLLVLSQAIPWLVQRAFDRRAAPVDAMGRLWLLFLLTALCSAAPFYAAFALRFDGLTPFLADLSDQLARYVQIPPSIEIANLLAACAAFGDAVLAWLIVRTVAQFHAAPGALRGHRRDLRRVRRGSGRRSPVSGFVPTGA